MPHHEDLKAIKLFRNLAVFLSRKRMQIGESVRKNCSESSTLRAAENRRPGSSRHLSSVVIKGLVSAQACSSCWELLWSWMEKERVGFPCRARGGGEPHKRRKRKGEAERSGGSSRCCAAGPWPSPEPVSSCPGSSCCPRGPVRTVVGALWLVFLEERGKKRCLGAGQSRLSKRARGTLQV